MNKKEIKALKYKFVGDKFYKDYQNKVKYKMIPFIW